MIKRILSKKFLQALSRLYEMHRFSRHGGVYKDVRLSFDDMQSEAYKKYLGGGPEGWDKRGQFQLYFLKRMGLLPSQKLLDIGCGPIRAGVFFIEYLNKSNYCGVEYNKDFIVAAKQIINNKKLNDKNPTVNVIENFNFNDAGVGKDFDYGIAFSVLNHCNKSQRHAFFNNISHILNSSAKLFITHASWYEPSYIERTNMKLEKNMLVMMI